MLCGALSGCARVLSDIKRLMVAGVACVRCAIGVAAEKPTAACRSISILRPAAGSDRARGPVLRRTGLAAVRNLNGEHKVSQRRRQFATLSPADEAAAAAVEADPAAEDAAEDTAEESGESEDAPEIAVAATEGKEAQPVTRTVFKGRDSRFVVPKHSQADKQSPRCAPSFCASRSCGPHLTC